MFEYYLLTAVWNHDGKQDIGWCGPEAPGGERSDLKQDIHQEQGTHTFPTVSYLFWIFQKIITATEKPLPIGSKDGEH